MTQVTFQNLNLSNAFLFAAALLDEEVCCIVLELIFGREFAELIVKSEHTILYNPDSRSVRLDIYATDKENRNYNLEMQNSNKKNLPKRARYHQAELDVSSLKPGEDFNQLKPSFVVFICTFDPFGQGLYRYTFKEQCQEIDMNLGDETTKLFLNTKGKYKENTPDELIHFLNYIEDSTEACARQSNDERIYRLHNKIVELKKSRNLEVDYMYLEEWLRDEKIAGREEGRAEGRAEERQYVK